ncbi:MAG: chemotaxis protein CheB [Alkalispirochaeta sp.]
MTTEQQQMRIVAVGASAGGLEALETFFGNMPSTTRFAFVVIQHLSPDYKSLMGELLSKHTTMEIVQGEDGMKLRPGVIHLIPRKKNMTIYQGTLFLTEQEHGLNLPIDIFMQSLAEDAGEAAVGVVLSGTGSDGTRGVRAIKEAGGLVIVQDEEDAKFNGMPRSAIATGIVDFVLPAEQIPAELQSFVTGRVQLVDEDSADGAGSSDSITKIFMLIKRKTGVDLSFYKENTIIRRLERRMGINQIHDVQRYIEFLEENPEEITTLFKEILIGVTRFFRDQSAFETLAEQVVPAVFTGKAPHEQIRVWVAGCSTGEEAYSIAILLTEYAERHFLHNEIKIFATDIDKDAIEFASYGTYPESIAADASRDRLTKYFVRKGESYQIVPSIREKVIFAYHNIFKDPPFRRVDLISCRNLLIYLQPILQKKVLSNFHFSLNEAGFLFLGSSETVGELTKYFRTIDTKWKIFAYKGNGSTPRIDSAASDTPEGWRDRIEISRASQLAQRTQLTQAGVASNDQSTQSRPRSRSRNSEPMYEELIQHYLPPTIVVDEERQVLHTFGDLSPFLQIPMGKMDLDVMKMARKSVNIPLGTALQTAIRENRTVAYEDVAVPTGDGGDADYSVVRLVVRPLRSAYNARFFAVIFDPQDAKPREESLPVQRFDVDESVQRRITDLENELQSTKENLQATIEELETSNEELQATNEELLSSNEELQSTNEELQSVNEELITVNSEYQKKIDELSELNDDMNNLLSGTAIGTVFLDEHLTIRKFTPPVAQQINIIKTDVGRPFADLSHNLRYDALLSDIKQVQESGRASELEVQNKDGHWFLVKIQSYRSEQEEVSPKGIVLSLVNITERKVAEEALLREHDLLMRVLNSNPSAIVMLDHRGTIGYANQRARELLGLTEASLQRMRHQEETLQVLTTDGTPIPSNQLPASLVTSEGTPVDDYSALVQAGPDGANPGANIPVRINGSPIYDEHGALEGAVLNLWGDSP